jgi:hypothetical protein
MSQVLKVICQICGEVVATTTLEALSFPIKGSMFQSPDPAHGVPSPWIASEEWEDMRCPYGRIHRAMVCHGIIRTDQGIVVVPSDGTPARIDSSVRTEIDRNSIPDRTIVMPEERAAKMVREQAESAQMVKCPINPEGATLEYCNTACQFRLQVIVTEPNEKGEVLEQVRVCSAFSDERTRENIKKMLEESDGEAEAKQGQPGTGQPVEGKKGFTCNICGKEVKTQRGLGQHIKMTHNLKGGQK